MRLRDSYGFTLTELLASVVLVGILALGFAMAMFEFTIGFQETREYLQLQREMLAAFDAMRHGYVKDTLNLTQPLIGLLSAKKTTISTDGQSITIIPIDGDVGGSRFYARFSRNGRDGTLLLNAQYGHNIGNNLQVFPQKKDLIGRENKYQITQLRFENLTPGLEFSQLIRITMTGRVRFRERSSRQTQTDDIRLNVRYAQFETIVFIGNADK